MTDSEHKEAYLQRLLLKSRARKPQKNVAAVLKFWEWMESVGLETRDLKLQDLVDYDQALRSGKLCKETLFYAAHTRAYLLSGALGWCRYLHKNRVLLTDITAEVALFYPGRRGGTRALSIGQVQRVLNAPPLHTWRGLRDRAVLELAYGSGLRCGEITDLTLDSLDLARRVVHLHDTKNGIDRQVPLTQSSVKALEQYLAQGRLQRVGPRVANALWVTGQRRAATLAGIGLIPGYYRDRTGFHFTLHDLRHSCATHLLEAGAPLAQISALLGHSQLDSTQLYAVATLQKLRDVHARLHPRG